MLFMDCLESDGELQQEEGVEKKLAVSVLYIGIYNYRPILSEYLNNIMGLFSV